MRRFLSTLSCPLYRYKAPISVPKFEQIFPGLLSYVSNFENFVQIGIPGRDYMKQNQCFHDKISPMIIESLPEWKRLEKMNRKRICYHTLTVLYCLLSSEEFDSYTDSEKNLLYWTSILHDISKRGTPLMSVPKDPFHPFSSAAYALKYLSLISDVDANTLRRVMAFDRKIMNAKIHKPMQIFDFESKLMNTVTMETTDLLKLPELLNELDSIYNPGSFHNTVVKLIMIHQCIPTLEKFSVNNQIHKKEVPKYLNKWMLKYFKTFTICDSNSYILNLFSHLIPVYKKEFDIVFQKYENICN